MMLATKNPLPHLPEAEQVFLTALLFYYLGMFVSCSLSVFKLITTSIYELFGFICHYLILGARSVRLR